MAFVWREIDRGWEALVATMKLIREYRSFVKVGLLGGSGDAATEDDKKTKAGRSAKKVGDQGRESPSDLTNVELGVIQEFGTEDGRIPARPFIGSTINAKREDYFKLMKPLLASIYEGKRDVRAVLDILGARAANDIKRAVTSGDGIPPPNAASTIAQKGSSRPLIDTGRMIGSLTWLVQIVSGDSDDAS